MSVCREVAVILSFNRDYDRKIAVGISRYAHQAGDWRIYLEDEPRNKLPADDKPFRQMQSQTARPKVSLLPATLHHAIAVNGTSH